MIYIYGGNYSGKSNFAEKYIEEVFCNNNKYYLACMKNDCKMAERRIRKHRKHRKHRQNKYTTIELFENDTNIYEYKFDKSKDIILLECMSTLCANYMYEKIKNKYIVNSFNVVEEKVKSLLNYLSINSHALIIIGNDIYSDCKYKDYDNNTKMYIDLMYSLHKYLKINAEQVHEIIYGIDVSKPCKE